MKTILATALLLGTIADSKNKQNQVQAVKIKAKSEEVLEQAAEAMTGIDASQAEASTADEALALREEEMAEEEALADIEAEEQLREEQQQDDQTDASKATAQPQAPADGTDPSKAAPAQQTNNQTQKTDSDK